MSGTGRGQPIAVDELLEGLHRLYPDADCELRHDDAFQLLVATILSAQTTDARVNEVTGELFDRYPTAEELASAESGEVEEIIRSTGFFRDKAKRIQGTARRLVEAYGGRVPEEMDDLLTLPGVARKTANVVLGTAFGKAEGVVVDTHVKRLAGRLGLSAESKPPKVEEDLMEALPREEWIFAGHALILHGRRVCTARSPSCDECGLREGCPRIGVDDPGR